MIESISCQINFSEIVIATFNASTNSIRLLTISKANSSRNRISLTKPEQRITFTAKNSKE